MNNDDPIEALRTELSNKRDMLDALKKDAKDRMGNTNDHVRKLWEDIAILALAHQDLYNQVSSLYLSQDGLKDQIELLNTILFAMPEVQNNTALMKQANDLLQKYNQKR